MEKFKKILKVLAIIAAVAAAIAGIYFAVTKLIEKKKAKDAENIDLFAANENFDGDFLTETIVVDEASTEEPNAE